MKLVFPVIGVVVATLVLTSRWFAHETHGIHRDRVIAGVVIVGVFTLIGIIASRIRRPKPAAAPTRPVYPFSGPRR